MSIGIVGYGVVGKAVHNSLPEDRHIIKTFDIGDKIEPCDAYFICVPTPTKNGQQDLSILYERLNDIDNDSLIIIKSTILPNAELPKEKNIMVSPEFLNQYEPYFKPEKHIIGVRNIYQAKQYRKIFLGMPYDEVRTTDIKTACMIKYVHNCFGCLKVTFFNEIFDICNQGNINYREMLGGLLKINNNVGKQYTAMSADGKRGFGGACFPKDSTAFANIYQPSVLKAAVTKNIKYRPEEMKPVVWNEYVV